MMNPMQKIYFKYMVIVVILWIVNYFLNPVEGLALILNWLFILSVGVLVMLYFDARKQYDKNGKKIIEDNVDEANLDPDKDETRR